LEDQKEGYDICLRFFPSMFKDGEDSNKRYKELIQEFNKVQAKHCVSSGSPMKRARTMIQSSLSPNDFTNELEKTILGINS
jgi:hypothetical protein